ncbi:MAG: NADH-dependent [FeFe] hydrogenase, group A6 [Erysipelotrichaceae bacterium]|nr:NADH-dependent [FeFe] hydrogenase, group A6 [Erysipelotrichaceae bacterium]
METVNIKINGRDYVVEKGITILEAARRVGVKIPTLCYLKDFTGTGACRVCMVEVKGARSLCASCVYPVNEGMEVFTHSQKAIEARRNTVELILSNHSKDCLTCIRNQSCELQQLANEVGARDITYQGDKSARIYDDLSDGIVRDTSKCVLCGRCVEVCKKVQGLGILGFQDRGFKTTVGPVMQVSLKDVNCMQCGQCVNACPVGALSEKEEIQRVVEALQDPTKKVIIQTAPAVRASLGEEFGMPIGSRVTGKMVAALKQIGFYRVYDTNFGADLTIMEEGTELIHRIQNEGTLPMITSCSPGWIRYAEREYPDLLDHLSTCKSPHMMLGAMIKSYFAENNQIDPKDIFNVSVMPCVAKKSEIRRPEMTNNGYPNVDAVLTTRELGRLIKLYGIDFTELPDETFDQDMFGEYTGAGVIFGTSGGVMEAALRTVYEILTDEPCDEIDFTAVRGTEGLKEASLNIDGLEVKVAIAHSMEIAKPLLEEIRAGKSPYHFIEIMGCPGGCINGGGQSIVPASLKNRGFDYKAKRAQALYEEDELMPKRKSHENQQIQDLYQNYLGKPCGHKSHELLHTHYSKKERFDI